MEGRSLVRALAGGTMEREALYGVHEGSRAIRTAKWKAVVAASASNRELPDMDAGRAEMKGLAAREPERVKSMARQ